MASCAIITGGAGLIGQYLIHTIPRWAPDRVMWGLTRADMDLTDRIAVERCWQTIKPDEGL